MLTMDYCMSQHPYAGSTMSSETLSGSCGSRSNRVRTIRLVRPSYGPLPPPTLTCRSIPSLGFSVRGGREHGTGFFVSYVEMGSEAHRQGLRVGDQIIRINGFTIDDAVHKEVLQLISNYNNITLKVRSVGMIPVKDKKTDSLSWQIVSDNSSLRSSPQLSDKIQDVRINIMVAPRSKLGCGICKGPEWKPGIFIQFTKEGGIARDAGLRPGDQILYCNNVDFSDIAFNEAVNLMKTSRQLDLLVRKAAGSELFPGESSGYNSSASSVTGDQSPSWSDSKRLSIVKEENLDLEDRLCQLDRRKLASCNKWETIEWDEPEPEEKTYFKPTIINLSENGTTIKNNGTDECQTIESHSVPAINKTESKLADLCLVSQQHEMKTVVVEVHRSNLEEKNKIDIGHGLIKSSSTSSFGSIASRSSNTSSSLSSAISQEIQRRTQQKQILEAKPSIDEQLQMKKILKGVSNDQQNQHSKLMDEFKRAHQKMFKPSNGNVDQNESTANLVLSEIGTLDRQASQALSQKLSERLSNLALQETANDRLEDTTNGCPPAPPPPPPLQENGDSLIEPNRSSESCQNTRTNTIKSHKPKPKAPPVPVKYSTLSYNQPPPCPTPDYDTLSLSSVTSSNFKPNNNNDTVEMESLDSFKLNNPSDVRPKPPCTYFHKSLTGQLSNGSTSSTNSTRKPRPVSVTISEYPSLRRQPGRLDFLNAASCNGRGEDQQITSQFASELAQTLRRSNLKNRTESMENLLDLPQIKPQSNGSVRISLSNNLSRSFAKSTSDLTESNIENHFKPLSNRVTISISQDKKQEPPNGILKNSSNSPGPAISPSHKPLVQQKSITFGEMPTVINDLSLRVT